MHAYDIHLYYLSVKVANLVNKLKISSRPLKCMPSPLVLMDIAASKQALISVIDPVKRLWSTLR